MVAGSQIIETCDIASQIVLPLHWGTGRLRALLIEGWRKLQLNRMSTILCRVFKPRQRLFAWRNDLCKVSPLLMVDPDRTRRYPVPSDWFFSQQHRKQTTSFLVRGNSTLVPHLSLGASISWQRKWKPGNKHHRHSEMASYLNSYFHPFSAFIKHPGLIGLSSPWLLCFTLPFASPLLSKLRADEEGKITRWCQVRLSWNPTLWL